MGTSADMAMLLQDGAQGSVPVLQTILGTGVNKVDAQAAFSRLSEFMHMLRSELGICRDRLQPVPVPISEQL